MTEQHEPTDLQATTSLEEFFDGETHGASRRVDDSAKDVGTRIAEARTATGQTQQDVANHLGVKVSSIEKWERGEASPRSSRLPALAGILGVSMSWLIIGHGDEPTSTDDVAEIEVALDRVHAQLTDTLNEVEVLIARLQAARDASS